ncbi:uncharacterized protein LAESUDRAFT_493536 [Laetiporus sulphureus 93-53]|uniref:Uncharacterized protein n=1 Tax=Laetiporus sulphureus 93-53 TaxID=1314785 RepID=A0A165BJA6_9APHY|nr:uncharacterized protein LAESUDRAFT_493536 [Laetiporus sulphureus 93-53]KZT01165.1 hypothetical protein LAESUDRAFT_493536 [Laetiporus sulphureus 93-53]
MSCVADRSRQDPIKTLEGDANEDGAKASNVEENCKETGDEQETRSTEKSQNVSEPGEVAGSKRKLPDDDEGEVDGEDPETSGDVRENDGKASVFNGDDDDEIEERARKKSKTADEDSAQVEHAGEGTEDIEDAE